MDAAGPGRGGGDTPPSPIDYQVTSFRQIIAKGSETATRATTVGSA
jgi:hypothetical protein